MKKLDASALKAAFRGALEAPNTSPGPAQVRIRRVGPRPTCGWKSIALGLALGVVSTFSIGFSSDAHANSPLFDSHLKDVQQSSIEAVLSSRFSAPESDKIAMKTTQVKTLAAFNGFIDGLTQPGGSASGVLADTADEAASDPGFPVAQVVVMNNPAEPGERLAHCAILLPEFGSSSTGLSLGEDLFKGVIDEVSSKTGLDATKVNQTLIAAIGGQYVPLPDNASLSMALSTFSASFIAGHEAGHCAYMARASVYDSGIDASMVKDWEALPDISGAVQALKAAASDADRSQTLQWLDLFAQDRLKQNLKNFQDVERFIGEDFALTHQASMQMNTYRGHLETIQQYVSAAYAMKGFISAYEADPGVIDNPVNELTVASYIEKGLQLAQENGTALDADIETQRTKAWATLDEKSSTLNAWKKIQTSSMGSAAQRPSGILFSPSMGRIFSENAQVFQDSIETQDRKKWLMNR